MKKVIAVFILLLTLNIFVSEVFAVTRVYLRSVLTGGTTGALDALDGDLPSPTKHSDPLNDGDKAIVITLQNDADNPQITAHYVMDADSGLAETPESPGVVPTVIAPDTNPGDKRWLLTTLKPGGLDAGTDAQMLISDGVNLNPRTLSSGATIDNAGVVQIGSLDGSSGGTIQGDVIIESELSVIDNCIINSHPAPNYKDMGDMLDVIDAAGNCVFLFSWLNVGAGNTEVNQCGSVGDGTYCDSAVSPCSGDSSWTTSDQVTVGQSYTLTFDGTDDVVAVADHADLTFDANFTMGGWVLATTATTTGENPIFSKWDAAKEFKLLFGVNFTNVWLRVRDDSVGGTTPLFQGSQQLTPGNWYFVVITHDDAGGSGATFMAGTELYINGVIDSSPTRIENAAFVDIEDGADVLNIGANVNQSYYFNSSLAKVFAIKGTALTAVQVNQLYVGSRGWLCQ